MILALEGKKIKHTGLLPAFLAGALAVSAFPVINMAFRTDLFISQDLPPVDILLNGNWDMAATFHCFLAILGACILYHTEFANRAIEKLYMLPVSQGKVFLCKNLLLLLLFLPVFLIEDLFFLFCAWHWFPGKDPGVEVLLGNTAFSLAAILPVLLLSSGHERLELLLFRMGQPDFFSALCHEGFSSPPACCGCSLRWLHRSFRSGKCACSDGQSGPACSAAGALQAAGRAVRTWQT